MNIEEIQKKQLSQKKDNADLENGAKKTVQNALIGFVIAMIAVQIVNVIGDII